MRARRFLIVWIVTGILLLVSGMASASRYAVGDRVWIGLYTDSLREDGYAVGTVKEILPDGRLELTITEFVEGKGKTLYGTCHPGASSPLAGAEIVENQPDRLLLRQTLRPEEVSPYRQGKDDYLERENVGTVFYKWMGDALGVTARRCRRAQEKAEAMSITRAVPAFEIACRQVESEGGTGFPVPLEQRLQGTADMLASVAELLREYPVAVERMQAKVQGTEELQGQDMVAMAAAKTLFKVRDHLEELWATTPTLDEARERVNGLEGIYAGYASVLTADGTRAFNDRSADEIRQAMTESIEAGAWPDLP